MNLSIPVSDFSQPNDKFDYISLESFPARYLKTYFEKVEQDEYEVAKFLVREYKKIKNKPIFLDLGCGPTIHHILPVAPYVSRIDVADYLLDNLDQVGFWKNESDQMHDWDVFTKAILAMEEKTVSKESVLERENLVRFLINEVSRCNLLEKNPLGEDKKYDAVGCFFCAEEVALTKEGWISVMENISNCVNSGGRLFLSALRETEYYSIESYSGEMQKLPTAYVKEEYFYELLPKLGFDLQETTLEVAQTPEQEKYGINSIILLSTKKK